MKLNYQAYFSIIIPVYNVEDYLQRCIDSILSQSFINFELLLIDDGSMDRSGDICDLNVALDSRVRVFHKKNEGVSSARNLGINEAKGIYIMFVDADDFIFPDSLEKINQNRLLTQSDIAIFNSYIFDVNGNLLREIYPFPIELSNKLFSGIELFQHYNRGSVWGGVYRKKFLMDNEILFSTKMKNAEDSLFFSLCLLEAQAVFYSDIDLYNVYERAGSASRSWSFDRVFGMLNGSDEIDMYIKSRKIDEYQRAVLYMQYYQIISNALYHFYQLPSLDGYLKIKKKITSSSLFPIPLLHIPRMRNKIRLLNFSFSIYSFLFLLRGKVLKR